MAREKIMSPRQKYAEKIGKTVFQRGTTAQYIAEISGINAATVRSWRIDPGKMPAYQYDKYITLTYGKGQDPAGLGECQKHIKNLRDYLSRIFRKAGEELKWILNIEVTKRGIYHVHFLVNALKGEDVGKLVRSYWKARHGAVVKTENTYLDGAFSKLAAYMAKTQRDQEGSRLSSFSRSRNLVDPPPEVTELKRRNVMARGEWKEIREPKGYELVKDSVYEGVDLLTGYPYRYYTLLKQGGG